MITQKPGGLSNKGSVYRNYCSSKFLTTTKQRQVRTDIYLCSIKGGYVSSAPKLLLLPTKASCLHGAVRSKLVMQRLDLKVTKK